MNSGPPMLTEIQTLSTQAASELAAAGDPAALEAWRVAYLGSSGRLKSAMAQLKDLPKDQRPAVGAKLNEVRAALEAAFERRRAELAVASDRPSAAQVDLTEPGLIDTRAVGRRHIISRVRESLVEVFARLGYEVALGPELEDDEHNFVKLNIPAGHPARDPIDNFYVDDPARVATPRMVRSQTSTVQIRVMEEMVRKGGGTLREPIRVISPGRVYRPDTVDATHSFMFHQLEGLCVDRHVTMADLKTTLYQFLRAAFGEETRLRFSPTFYPFTEPSAQFEVYLRLRPDLPARWIELGGCGMVDPNVFRACGIDPEEWSGFAFGFGIERIAMGMHAIPDIRLLFENDLRFLRQV